MRPLLLLFALLAGGAAVYLASDRGVSDLSVIATAAAAVFALVMSRMTPAGRPENRKGWAPAPVRSAAIREEASELAAGLAAIAVARGGPGEVALSAGDTVSVLLTKVGPNQIAVIKAVRQHLRLGLREAKTFTDAAKRGERPVLHKAMPSAIAREFARDVERAGGKLELR